MSITPEMTRKIRSMAQRMRLRALEMAFGAGNSGAHLGSAMSCMEIFAILFGGALKLDPSNPLWPERDRFIASKAHCVLAYYPALAEAGFLTNDDLDTFKKSSTRLAGHPSMNAEYGIEYSGGSLGMALSVGVGMALDAKIKRRDNRVYILLGDGECNEGSNWEAFLAASHFKLNNLIAVIDKNNLQYDGFTDDVMSLSDLESKLRSFDWSVTSVDGHDVHALLEAFSRKCDAPYAIIANTVKGKGVSFMENSREWHHSRLTERQYEIAAAEVRG